jgi:hypothetical protein
MSNLGPRRNFFKKNYEQFDDNLIPNYQSFKYLVSSCHQIVDIIATALVRVA